MRFITLKKEKITAVNVLFLLLSHFYTCRYSIQWRSIPSTGILSNFVVFVEEGGGAQ